MAKPNSIEAGECRCNEAMTTQKAKQSWLACRPPRHSPFLWPVSGLTKAPLHLPARVMLFLAQWLPAYTALRACVEAGSASLSRCARSPLRGQHRLIVPAWSARTRACFPFNCTRRNARTSTRLGASVRAVSASVKERARLEPASRRTRPRHCLCYLMAAPQAVIRSTRL